MSDSTLGIMIIAAILGMIINYFIIKYALISAMKEYDAGKNSGNDLQIKQTKLIAEIAKKNGVEQEVINKILLIE